MSRAKLQVGIAIAGVTSAPLSKLTALYPTIDHALARVSVLSARLHLPKRTIHVVSDVHGEYAKLRHVVNNGSGSLPVLVKQLFDRRLSPEGQLELLSYIYYPRETYLLSRNRLGSHETMIAHLRPVFSHLFEVVAHLTERYSFEHLLDRIPVMYTHLFRELVIGPRFGRSETYLSSMIDRIFENERDLEFLRLTCRLVRNMLIGEIIVAGDFGDRGPRIDKCIEFVSQQPAVSVTWGNHDAAWMGACLGQTALIASVIRVSLRYGRIAQLEEGYGVSLAPLEQLARTVYGEDPAVHFKPKHSSPRDSSLVARMQKAIAIIQFKLDAETIRRNPHFALEDRALIRKVSLQDNSVTIGDATYALRDTFLPTLSPENATLLTHEEKTCIDALQASFLSSPVMWKHMRFLARTGSMHLVRDRSLIFHGCVPVSPGGDFLSFSIDGNDLRGRELFDSLAVVVQRAFQFQRQTDLDLLWYLWCGPLSPLFGKDKIATFESCFIEDAAAHKEVKNPYFDLIHNRDFCAKVLREFDVDSDNGLIVNGHVPVKIEKGEPPMKRSNMAVTIDGAFSEAYGDKGYTLVLDADRTYLAQHGHFESVESSLRTGADMIPEILPLAEYSPPRTVGHTEEGREIRSEIELLKELIDAYRKNQFREAL